MRRWICGIAAALLLAATQAHAAPSLIGYWTTTQKQAVVQIYDCGQNRLCGELVGFPMDHATDAMPLTWNNQPQCHFVFIRYLTDRGDVWKGSILNPRSGNNYGAELQLAAPNQLKLRGYLITPALGKTQLWSRYQGPPPPWDCRMPGDALN